MGEVRVNLSVMLPSERFDTPPPKRSLLRVITSLDENEKFDSDEFFADGRPSSKDSPVRRYKIKSPRNEDYLTPKDTARTKTTNESSVRSRASREFFTRGVSSSSSDPNRSNRTSREIISRGSSIEIYGGQRSGRRSGEYTSPENSLRQKDHSRRSVADSCLSDSFDGTVKTYSPYNGSNGSPKFDSNGPTDSLNKTRSSELSDTSDRLPHVSKLDDTLDSTEGFPHETRNDHVYILKSQSLDVSGGRDKRYTPTTKSDLLVQGRRDRSNSVIGTIGLDSFPSSTLSPPPSLSKKYHRDIPMGVQKSQSLSVIDLLDDSLSHVSPSSPPLTSLPLGSERLNSSRSHSTLKSKVDSFASTSNFSNNSERGTCSTKSRGLEMNELNGNLPSLSPPSSPLLSPSRLRM